MQVPWYDLVEGEGIEQGDLLNDCPVVLPRVQPGGPQEAAGLALAAEVQYYDVVVMTQSCDLVAGKVPLILLCPHWPFEALEAELKRPLPPKEREEIRRGNRPGYHLLAPCDLAGKKSSVRIVDFTVPFAVPIEFLRKFAAGVGKRVRLLPPYREHLSQAFARFFMRVGLPVDIPPFR